MFTPKSSRFLTSSRKQKKLNTSPYSSNSYKPNVFEIEEALRRLKTYYQLETKCKKSIKDVLKSDLSVDERERYIKTYEHQIQITLQSEIKLLENLLKFPPHLTKHAQKLEEFYLGGDYEQSVFIMTKYPEGNNPKDKALQRVINSVKRGVQEKGLVPRIGSDKAYYEGVWDNVELYLCGCKYAIAIVENKYKDELNPNVAMEWGWMRAMNKKVLYLVENDFDKERADLSGLIKSPFEWDNPEKGINKAIRHFLPPIRSS